MIYNKIVEGNTILEIPVSDIPEHARKYGFYNPEMKTDRDLSIAILKIFSNIFIEKFGNQPDICDLLCATGARGIRYKKEVGGNVLINDVNENALSLAKKNSDANGIELEISFKDANVLLSERSFDIIDIDPFGSPYQFIDSAARSIKDFGLLCITATDTAALFGVYPEVCERRYGIKNNKCDFEKELGVRILLSFVMRELAKYNKAFKPILCYSKRHYVRLYGIVEKNARDVEKIVDKFDFLSLSKDSWHIGENSNNNKLLGKIYLGPLHDKEFCIKTLDKTNEKEARRILSTCIVEPECIFYHNIKNIFKGRRQTKMADIISKLVQNEFKAGRTIFDEMGIKTDANREDIEKIMKSP